MNNSELWEKIQQLRTIIKHLPDFKERACWNCGKDLNIYDFLSDNLEYDAIGIMDLWQNSILEFHCCECFKDLKIAELMQIERDLKHRKCGYCNKTLELYRFSKVHNFLKIKELKEVWLNLESPVFCDKICNRKFLKIKFDALHKE